MKKKALLTILQYALFFGLGFLLVYGQYTRLSTGDKNDIAEAWQQVQQRLWLVVPVIIIGFLSHFFRALRWRLMLDPLGLRPSVFNTTCAVLIGYLTNLLLPRMGEIAKCTVLARYEREPADKIIGTIVAERAFDLLCLLFITLAAFVVQADVIGAYLQDLGHAMKQKNLPMLVPAAALGLLLLVGVLLWIYKRNRQNKIGRFIKGMGDGLRAILQMRRKWLFLLYTAMVWGCYFSLIYIGFWSIAATEHLGGAAALSVLVFGSLGMIVTPGGLGAYPAAIQIVLFRLYHIAQSFGLAYGWISWLAQTLIIIIFGIMALLWLPLYNRNHHGQTTVDTK
jgi:uncharacterized membrane protein YbhN (UPF0104 family)